MISGSTEALGERTSTLICRRALASMVDTLDGLDVEGDLT